MIEANTHSFPIPESAVESGFLKTKFNWEFDFLTMSVGVAELRDGKFPNYVSVLPRPRIVELEEACGAEMSRSEWEWDNE